MNRPVRIVVIGATGSVGSSVLDVCRAYPEFFTIVGLAAGSNVESLFRLAHEFSPSVAYLADPVAAQEFRSLAGNRFPCLEGSEGLLALSCLPDADQIVFASSGTAAIPALIGALDSGKDISLANKESILVAAPWVMPKVSRPNQIRPLDSEHNAIWQCLRNEDIHTVNRLILTASGGPFRSFSMERMRTVTPEEALRHPVWLMGAKISIDSATLMNKGIEIIEASLLFSMPIGRVEAILSPGSFAHGIVEFIDGTMKIAASIPDMRLPSLVAMSFPNRLPLRFPSLKVNTLHEKTIPFEEPDIVRFPAIGIAKEAGRRGGAYPALLVGADEVAVEAFLRHELTFLDIPRVVEQTLEMYDGPSPSSPEDAIALVDYGRRQCRRLCTAATV
jgi:1-deoxy-D-xylulose-5-phosphate reductoisomerase